MTRSGSPRWTAKRPRNGSGMPPRSRAIPTARHARGSSCCGGRSAGRARSTISARRPIRSRRWSRAEAAPPPRPASWPRRSRSCACSAIRAALPQGDLRLFLGAEEAHEILHAPPLAANLFRQLATQWPDSPYAPKALLAAQVARSGGRRIRAGPPGQPVPRQPVRRHAPRRGRRRAIRSWRIRCRHSRRGNRRRRRGPAPVAALPPATTPDRVGRPSAAGTRSRTTTSRPADASPSRERRRDRALADRLRPPVPEPAAARRRHRRLRPRARRRHGARPPGRHRHQGRLAGAARRQSRAAGGRVSRRDAQLRRAGQPGARAGADRLPALARRRTCAGRRSW